MPISRRVRRAISRDRSRRISKLVALVFDGPGAPEVWRRLLLFIAPTQGQIVVFSSWFALHSNCLIVVGLLFVVSYRCADPSAMNVRLVGIRDAMSAVVRQSGLKMHCDGSSGAETRLYQCLVRLTRCSQCTLFTRGSWTRGAHVYCCSPWYTVC